MGIGCHYIHTYAGYVCAQWPQRQLGGYYEKEDKRKADQNFFTYHSSVRGVPDASSLFVDGIHVLKRFK